jgi:predicted MFS family arabinose efflux permease
MSNDPLSAQSAAQRITLPTSPGPVRATYAALGANLVGTGLGRFAYTPLIPALIAAQWLTPGQAAAAAAANLTGYLGGALLAQRMTAWLGVSRTLRGSMLVATAAFFGCAFPLSVAWFAGWRVLAGAAGAMLMVVAAPTALARVPAGRRGLAGGAIFGGVGLGVAASGTLVPWVLPWGLATTWCVLGGLAALLTMSVWSAWPAEEKPALPAPKVARHMRVLHAPALLAIYALYGLNAVGVVPHMVFLADFIARGLGQGVERAATYWILFGVGAVAGPPLVGPCADRFGFGRTLRYALLVELAAVLAPVFTAHPVALAASSFIVGALIAGVVPLTLGSLQELLPGDLPGQRAAWSIATTCFALGLSGGSFGYSYLFAQSGRHTLLFAVGAGALVASCAAQGVADVLAVRWRRRNAGWAGQRAE